MVRINLIDPRKLSDQHLIAEYNEILMLLGHLKKHGIKLTIPENYVLGKGHITFFKNKIVYLKNRHEKIKSEMSMRGFQNKITIDLKKFSKQLHNNWYPKRENIKLIKKRITSKINQKPDFYRYFSQKKNKNFFIKLLK